MYAAISNRQHPERLSLTWLGTAFSILPQSSIPLPPSYLPVSQCHQQPQRPNHPTLHCYRANQRHLTGQTQLSAIGCARGQCTAAQSPVRPQQLRPKPTQGCVCPSNGCSCIHVPQLHRQGDTCQLCSTTEGCVNLCACQIQCHQTIPYDNKPPLLHRNQASSDSVRLKIKENGCPTKLLQHFWVPSFNA
jgi:hypothetical protein